MLIVRFNYNIEVINIKRLVFNFFINSRKSRYREAYRLKDSFLNLFAKEETKVVGCYFVRLKKYLIEVYLFNFSFFNEFKQKNKREEHFINEIVQNINHEYLHFVFNVFKLGIEQEHYIINKLKDY